MNKHIAILRGINVGGKKRILMKDLKLLMEELGLQNVQTYIQSGNIIFHAPTTQSKETLEQMLETAIHKQYGFEVPVIVRQPQELLDIVKKLPYKEHGIEHLHLTFLKTTPTAEAIDTLHQHPKGGDLFSLLHQEVFIYCEGKYHQSKLSNQFFESRLKVKATTRNWKTILKLVTLSTSS
ncbi:DUF1697 domain-containing protein [Algivirga pacifica]|uniref:DUF1697 domain-containing protein n=1 Tax=Algivirga pacifica TaxID=1162670 RepID=A0ABP9D2B8_9BACT